jgi:DNA repair exonuclease SbcCD ATPase subunit
MIGKTEVNDIRFKYTKMVGKQNLLEEQLDQLETDIASLEQNSLNCQKARAIVQVVAEETQKKIEYQISNLVSLALASVFPDPYEFCLRFVQRRNKTEADLIFIKNGNEGDPINVSGGGALDVASFALRAAIWSIKPSNNVMILDEPFHFLSRNLQDKCSSMIKMISDKLKLQFIIVSHIPEITEAADKVFKITNLNGISEIGG